MNALGFVALARAETQTVFLAAPLLLIALFLGREIVDGI